MRVKCRQWKYSDTSYMLVTTTLNYHIVVVPKKCPKSVWVKIRILGLIFCPQLRSSRSKNSKTRRSAICGEAGANYSLGPPIFSTPGPCLFSIRPNVHLHDNNATQHAYYRKVQCNSNHTVRAIGLAIKNPHPCFCIAIKYSTVQLSCSSHRKKMYSVVQDNQTPPLPSCPSQTWNWT